MLDIAQPKAILAIEPKPEVSELWIPGTRELGGIELKKFGSPPKYTAVQGANSVVNAGEYFKEP